MIEDIINGYNFGSVFLGVVGVFEYVFMPFYDCMKWLSATLIRGLGVETMSGPGLYVNHIHISAVGQLQRGTDLFEVLETAVDQHLSYQPLT